MSTRRYYEQELAYLRELGDAFSRQNPDIAGLISSKAADPDVERLLEGFAFLTGRLRQRLDEQLPELAQGLMSMLGPQYLRPVPAMTIVEFDAPTAAMTVTTDAQLLARPVDGVMCRFRPCHDLDLVPAQLSQVRLEERAKSATLTIELTPTGDGVAALAAQPLRLFLHGKRERVPGPQLLHALLTDTVAIEVTDGVNTAQVAPGALRHAGVDATLLPWPGNAFGGLRILQQSLALPEGLLFIALPAVPATAGWSGRTLTWRIRLGTPPQLPARISAECIRLNCVPAINLYRCDGQPITPDADRVEHRIIPQVPNAAATVHTVERVQGIVQGRPTRIDYSSFASYEHALPGASGAYFMTRLRPATLGRGVETWISFVTPAQAPTTPDTDLILTQLICTDGELARGIGIGALDQPGGGTLAGLGFRNVTPVTPEAAPPTEGDVFWRLISGLSRSLQPLDDLMAFRALIASYDMAALRDEPARRRLELRLASMQSIEIVPLETVVKGIPVRGREIRLTVQESGFGGIAEAFVFGAAVDGFLGLYAGLNTCWRLVLLGSETKAEVRWPIKAGQGKPL